MNIWITGIAGFLGSHLAESLKAQGHNVYGNDSGICNSMPISPLFKFDCTDFEKMKRNLKHFEIDTIVHCAATAAEGLSVFSPYFITRNIAEASVATFSAAISAGVKRIVNFSSMARYGHGYVSGSLLIGPPFDENYETNPVDPYGVAKVYAENQLKLLCKEYGVKWANVVPHNVVGTHQQITPYRNVITIFLNRLKQNLPVYIYGDGLQKRSFSPVKDCLHSLLQIIDGAMDGQTINIGPDDNEITINEALEMCEQVTGVVANRIYLPPRPITDTVKNAYCSSDKARKYLGYRSQQHLIDCIREMSDEMQPVKFNYDFPIEILTDKTPKTWTDKL